MKARLILAAYLFACACIIGGAAFAAFVKFAAYWRIAFG